MSVTVFQPRPLPGGLALVVRSRLDEVHTHDPFSTLDPRETVRRAAAVLGDLGVETTVYRGGLDLRGIEVDHVWLGVAAPQPWVVDAAFPLLAPGFVAVLRRFVAGDAAADELAAAAAEIGMDARVVGDFPAPMRYRGLPVWSARA